MDLTGLDLSPGSAAWNCVSLSRLLHLSEAVIDKRVIVHLSSRVEERIEWENLPQST